MSIFSRAAGLSYLQRLPASSVANHFIAKNIATKQPRSFSLKFKLFNGIDNIAIARQRQYHVLNRTKKFHTSLQMNTKKKISSIIVRNNNNSNIFKQQGQMIDYADRQTDMLDDAQKSESRQEEKDKDAKLAQENRFSKLSRNFTKGIAGLGKKFDSLTEGIVGKVGLATILTFLFASFVNNYRPFAEAITKVIVALGKFFKDLGLVIDGEMNFGQFLKENLVAIAGGFLFMFRKFIITKLFGGLTRRIAASIKLIGKTAGSKIAMAGKLFLKVLARFFLLPMIIFKAITGFFDGYMKKIESGGTFFEALGAGFLGALQNVFDFLADGVMFIVDALKSLFDPIIDAITGGLKSAYNFFKKLVFGEDIEGRYMGGPVAAGSPYLVGEKGPELFVPGASGGVVANNNMGGGAPIIVNNNQVNAPTSNHSHQHSNISITDSQQEITGL